MKKYLIVLVVMMCLVFVPPASPSFVVGDIDFSKISYKNYLHKEQIGNYIEKIHEYPDESIKVVKVIGSGLNGWGVESVSYLKDGELFVYEQYENEANYSRVTDLSSDVIKSITDKLKMYIRGDKE